MTAHSEPKVGRRLAGKVALVMGAGASGQGMSNGRAAAILFAREGAKVVAVDISPESAKETAELIRGEGHDAISLGGDVSREDHCDQAVAAAVHTFGRLDVLHNNVGILRRGGLIEHSLEDWDTVLRVNLTGTFLACRAAVSALAADGGGSIVNVSSASGIRYLGVPYVAYSASKAALLQLSAVTAMEMATLGVRVNVVVPGLIDTPMATVSLRGAYGDHEVAQLRQARERQVPMGRMGDPWDVAHAALFLASDEAKYVTGTSIVVDGGLTAKC